MRDAFSCLGNLHVGVPQLSVLDPFKGVFEILDILVYSFDTCIAEILLKVALKTINQIKSNQIFDM